MCVCVCVCVCVCRTYLDDKFTISRLKQFNSKKSKIKILNTLKLLNESRLFSVALLKLFI